MGAKRGGGLGAKLESEAISSMLIDFTLVSLNFKAFFSIYCTWDTACPKKKIKRAPKILTNIMLFINVF